MTRRLPSFTKKSLKLKVLDKPLVRGSLTLLHTPISAIFVFPPKLEMPLTSCCIAFWDSVYLFTTPGPPGELMASEKLTYEE